MWWLRDQGLSWIQSYDDTGLTLPTLRVLNLNDPNLMKNHSLHSFHLCISHSSHFSFNTWFCQRIYTGKLLYNTVPPLLFYCNALWYITNLVCNLIYKITHYGTNIARTGWWTWNLFMHGRIRRMVISDDCDFFWIQYQALFNFVLYLFFYLAYKYTVISIIYKWKTSAWRRVNLLISAFSW